MLGEEGGEISNDMEGEIDSLCDGPCHVTLKKIILN
jgi:hypothetical protein